MNAAAPSAADGGGVATPAPSWQRALRRLVAALADALPPELGAMVLAAFDALADRLGVAAALAAGRVVSLESGRRLAVGRVLGEGGYATVYLARDADGAGAGEKGVAGGESKGRRRPRQTTATAAGPFALKRVADGGSVAAQREEAALRDVRGCPGVAELLEACRAGRGGDPAAGGGGRGTSGAAAGPADAPLLLLFPAYAGGTLQEELERRRRRLEDQEQRQQQKQGGRRPGPRPIHIPRLLPARGVLAVAAQVGAALSHVHARGWVHRDVKPHNVMLVFDAGAGGEAWSNSRGPGGGGRAGGGGGGGALFAAVRRRAAGYGRVTGSDDDADDGVDDGVELAPLRHAAAGSAAATAAPPPSSAATPPDDNNANATDDDTFLLLRPRVVLIDFGSASRWPIAVNTRQEARLVQEEAEAHVTATYRAPELFDVPSPPCELGPAMDVWALGCALFACMYGAPPFEPAPGGSVALAALAGRVPWPEDGAAAAGKTSYPPALVELVRSCLATDPARRPSAGSVAQRARELLLAGVGEEEGGGGGGGGGSSSAV